MSLVLRLITVFMFFQMMVLNHCSGNIKNQTVVSAANTTDEYNPLDTHFSLGGFYEIIELKESKESSEEENVKKVSASAGLSNKFTCLSFLTSQKALPTDRFLNFKHYSPPLFILFHSWRYHI